jgi:hypothetical protein
MRLRIVADRPHDRPGLRWAGLKGARLRTKLAQLPDHGRQISPIGDKVRPSIHVRELSLLRPEWIWAILFLNPPHAS